jgi:octaprenyl-diphosphate synthase
MDLAKLLEPIRADMDSVEAELARTSSRIAAAVPAPAQAPLGILESIARHPFAVPGKRLRPALVLLSARAAAPRRAASVEDREASGAGPAAVGLAAAVEVLHSASLVHDDIIDGATERRHQVSLNQRFGNRVAVLAGDILYTEFFELITRLPVEGALGSRLLSIFLGTTRKMCVGEILAQEAEAAKLSFDFEGYVELCYDKTASLFASCCEGGALVGGAGELEAAAFREFGALFGLAFQMLDDLADGDQLLDPAIDLGDRAAEYVDRARDAARSLGLSDVSSGMAGLLDYVMAQSR